MSSIRQQLINVSYTLISNEQDFTKQGSTFRYHDKVGRRMQITNSYDGSVYTIKIFQYDDADCTSLAALKYKTYTHHKPINAEYFSYLLSPFK